jgi:hypothetical protein
MTGRQDRDQGQLFYEFNLDAVIPKEHLLRRMNVFVTGVLADVHQQLKSFYSDIGRPSVDPELMIRMLIVGYCYSLRFERKQFLFVVFALHLPALIAACDVNLRHGIFRSCEARHLVFRLRPNAKNISIGVPAR